MINFRPSIPEDVVNIQLRPQYGSESGIKSAVMQDLKNNYPAYSLVHENGEVLAIICGGFIWNGVMAVCALISEKIKKYPVGATKATVQLMDGYRKMHGIHRIQVTVRDDFPEAKKWVTFLGFYFEGRLLGYGQDKTDYLMFARYF